MNIMVAMQRLFVGGIIDTEMQEWTEVIIATLLLAMLQSQNPDINKPE
jgi:hypothetical protein